MLRPFRAKCLCRLRDDAFKFAIARIGDRIGNPLGQRLLVDRDPGRNLPDHRCRLAKHIAHQTVAVVAALMDRRGEL
mgnify:CR=1 FL=1